MISVQEVPGLEDELLQVNRHMERLCMSNSPSMQKMVDWVLNARGKQIRPILTLLCSRLKGKKWMQLRWRQLLRYVIQRR